VAIPIRLSRAIHLISAFWTLALALLIFLDVCSRSMIAQPIPGTKEIVQNSIVAITFLQLPLAIYSGSMLRTTVFADAVPAPVRRLLRTIAYLLGAAVFVGLVIGSWVPFLDSYRIGEYEGEGALRVPVWPLRGIILLASAFGVCAYVSMIYYDWTNQLRDESEAPESSDKATA